VNPPTRLERRSLSRVVRGAIADAVTAGLDDLAATNQAIVAVRSARRDMTASDAIKAVERLRAD